MMDLSAVDRASVAAVSRDDAKVFRWSALAAEERAAAEVAIALASPRATLRPRRAVGVDGDRLVDEPDGVRLTANAASTRTSSR